MPSHLTQVFNESAASLHAAFPTQLKNLIVLMPKDDEPFTYIAEEALALFSNAADRQATVEGALNFLQQTGYKGFATRCQYGDETVTVAVIDHLVDVNAHSWTEDEMARVFTFDHEIGHLVVKNGTSDSKDGLHLAECAADAFAALRHIQRYGEDTGYLENKSRADVIIFGLFPAHYTDNVVQKAIEQARITDIKSLSLQETAELAAKIAIEHFMSDEALVKISDAFRPLAEMNRAVGGWDDSYPLRCYELMQKYPEDRDIRLAAHRYLRNSEMRGCIEYYAQDNPDWQKVLEFVDGPNNPAPTRNAQQKTTTKPRI